MNNTRDHLVEINSMLELGFTMEQVGMKFGVSKQRIGQLVGKIKPLRARRNNMLSLYDTASMTNRQLSDLMGISSVSSYRNGERHAIEPNCNCYTGHYWEEKVIQKLNDIGLYAVGQSFNSPFDILVNNKIKIDVKAAITKFNPPSNPRTSPVYKFGLRNHNIIDYFVLIVVESEDYFIVPTSETPVQLTQLIMTWPSKRPTMGKYQKYHNRWDIIIQVVNDMKEGTWTIK